MYIIFISHFAELLAEVSHDECDTNDNRLREIGPTALQLHKMPI